MSLKQYYHSLDIYKKGFWLNLVLIFIEGAMRKWFMPEWSYWWMVCREPIVIGTVLALMNTRHLNSWIAKAFMSIGAITFITTLLFGHHNLIVAIYGLRIWFFHIPYIFIMAEKLNRIDLIKICQFLIIIFLPMTILYIIQWASPPNSWSNAQIGGIIAKEETVVYGAVRPNGTFGHGVGASYYNSIVVCLFVATLFSKHYRKYLVPHKAIYLLFSIVVIAMLIVSVSRGTIVQACITAALVALLLCFTGKSRYLVRLLAGGAFVFFIFQTLSNISINGKNLLAPVTSRFETAAKIEGGTSGIFDSRVLEPYRFWNDKGVLLTPPVFGYGIGAGSNFGTQTLKIVNQHAKDSSAWGLGEWSSQIVTNEMGFLFGTIVYFLRIGFPLYLFFIALRKLRRNYDILPLSLWTLSVPFFGNGNINLVMSLGWIVILMVLLLASIRTSEKNNIHKQMFLPKHSE